MKPHVTVHSRADSDCRVLGNDFLYQQGFGEMRHHDSLRRFRFWQIGNKKASGHGWTSATYLRSIAGWTSGAAILGPLSWLIPEDQGSQVVDGDYCGACSVRH